MTGGTEGPTQHERDELESAVTDALMEWHGDASGTQHVTEYVLAAGFRRVEVTDEMTAMLSEARGSFKDYTYREMVTLIRDLAAALSAALGEETPT